MPIYEYECSNCGYVFEKEQKISARVLKRCPECRKMKLQRLISGGAGIIFKGPGFYVTDSKKPSPEKKGKSEPKTAPVKDTAAEKTPAKTTEPDKKPADQKKAG